MYYESQNSKCSGDCLNGVSGFIRKDILVQTGHFRFINECLRYDEIELLSQNFSEKYSY